MIIVETVYNDLEINSDFLLEYFDSLKKEESPSIDELINYLDRTYYLFEFITRVDINHEGDETELKECYIEYLNNNND